jgi:hypothetical protein
MSQHDTTDQPVPPAADLFQAVPPASAAYREAWDCDWRSPGPLATPAANL